MNYDGDYTKAPAWLALYMAYRIPVFPCRPGGKAPITPNGFKDATTDPERIEAWWDRHPDANVGMRTGARFDVLDFDRKPGGVDAVADALPRLNRAGLLAGAVASATTRNGGVHLYYPASGQPCSSVRGQGVDFKANGGYVLLPPSRVPSDYPDLDGRYLWDDFPSGEGRPLDWAAVKRLLQPPTVTFVTHVTLPRGGELDRLLGWLGRQSEGNRNRALYWAAGKALQSGVFDAEQLLGAARALGLPEREAEATIKSAQKRFGERS